MKTWHFYIIALLAACGSGAVWARDGLVIINPGVIVEPQQPTQLESSNPAADSTVAAPSDVTLTFSRPLPAAHGSYNVRVTDDYGYSAADDRPSVFGKTLTVNLKPDLTAGRYTVRYSVNYPSDTLANQRISGTFRFTVQ